MANGKLSHKTIKLIENLIDHAFEGVSAHALGPSSVGKKIYIGHDNFLSLPGIAENAARLEGVRPDSDVLDVLTRVAMNHLDAIKFKARARVISTLQHTLQDAATEPNIVDILSDELAKIWDSLGSEVSKVVETEANKFRNSSLLEGTVQMATSMGDNDPTIFFIIVRDDQVCDECMKLHVLPNGITPRVWKLSEASSDYHKRGEDSPSLQGEHPSCRCQQNYLPPGWGFDASGKIAWRHENWDEFSFQRSLPSLTPSP